MNTLQNANFSSQSTLTQSKVFPPWECENSLQECFESRPWKETPLPMNRKNGRTLTPSQPSVEGHPYSQGRALFTSIVDMGVFFKLHMLQIARVANCTCCKLQALQIACIANCKCCKLQVLQISGVAHCTCWKLQMFQIASVANC